jgi:hypothetical protein
MSNYTAFDPACYVLPDRYCVSLPFLSIERGHKNEKRRHPTDHGKANQIEDGTDTFGLGVLVGTATDFSDSTRVGDLASQVGVPAGVCDVRRIHDPGTCLRHSGHLVAPGPQQLGHCLKSGSESNGIEHMETNGGSSTVSG